jgi:hypothetical protein
LHQCSTAECDDKEALQLLQTIECFLNDAENQLVRLEGLRDGDITKVAITEKPPENNRPNSSENSTPLVDDDLEKEGASELEMAKMKNNEACTEHVPFNLSTHWLVQGEVHFVFPNTSSFLATKNKRLTIVNTGVSEMRKITGKPYFILSFLFYSQFCILFP